MRIVVHLLTTITGWIIVNRFYLTEEKQLCMEASARSFVYDILILYELVFTRNLLDGWAQLHYLETVVWPIINGLLIAWFTG